MAKNNGHDMWVTLERRHKEKLMRKVQRINVLRALEEMHAADPNHDHEYLVGLRSRLRTAESNFQAMKP